MTLRHLYWMARARRRDEWDRTANLMSLIALANSKKGSKPINPDEFNPVDDDSEPVELTPAQEKAIRREKVRVVGQMLAQSIRKKRREKGL